MGWKYRVSTLGCKVNQYESQQVREILESLGGVPAGDGESADLSVVNTCAVTSNALRRSGQEARRLVSGTEGRVVVIGCGASADAERFRRISGVDAVWGHGSPLRASLQRLLQELPTEGTNPPHTAGDAANSVSAAILPEVPSNTADDVPVPIPSIPDEVPARRVPTTPRFSIIPPHLAPVKPNERRLGSIHRFDGHQRAFLKIQDGCDAHCTYCIIPQLRSEVRWKPVPEAVDEARQLVRAGHREIVVTGIFLGAYGRETALRRRSRIGGSPLAELVDALAQVEGLERLRLSSLEPGDVSNELLDVLRRRPACVPHLHLPLQSGSAEILRRMNRQYSLGDFLDMIDRVRATLDRPAISTDVIVGFPGESDADFGATLSAARHARFVKIHAFPFSPRQHTAAARWQKAFVPSEVIRQRMWTLAELERDLSLDCRRSAVGTTERVIVEADDPEDEDAGQSNGRGQPAKRCVPGCVDEGASAIVQGRSDRYFRVHFPAEGAAAGSVVRVCIERVTPTRTHGRRVHPF